VGTFPLAEGGEPPPSFDLGLVGGGVRFTSETLMCLAHDDDPVLRSGGSNRSYTFTLWVKLDRITAPPQAFISKWDVGKKEYAISYDSKPGTETFKFWFTANGSHEEYVAATELTGLVVPGVWYFIAAGFDHVADHYWLRVDDMPKRFKGWPHVIFEGDAPLMVGILRPDGSGGALQGLDGVVDAVYYFHHTLADWEMDQLYNNGLGAECNDTHPPALPLETRVSLLEEQMADHEARLQVLEGQ
jgi:hypothetical protein